MKLIFPEISTTILFKPGVFPSLVIENQDIFYSFTEDLYQQFRGYSGKTVLSLNDTPIPFSSNLDLLANYFPFEINRKNLLNKLLSVLEKEALSPEFYDRTQRLLGQTEQWIYDLAFATDNELEPKGISIVSLLKAAGIEFREDYHSLSEKILAYMDMVSNYDLAKLFVFINARSFINDRNMELFTENCIKKGFSILLIDSSEHPRLSLEERHVIDGDLCEF